MESVNIDGASTPNTILPGAAVQENLPLSEQESAINSAIDARSEEDEDEMGCYHCREEGSTGYLGRIVAVYKPGRPANRARDRPARSRKLEIFTEVGERCETAMMLMCTRIDDLFMSVPAQKRGSLVTSRTNRGTVGNSSGGDGTAGEQPSTAPTTGGMDRNDDLVNEGAVDGGGELDQGGTGQGQYSSSSFAAAAASSPVSHTKRLLGTRRDWLFRLRWLLAAILIAVVLVLVLIPRNRS